jgi:hypothetical protein
MTITIWQHGRMYVARHVRSGLGKKIFRGLIFLTGVTMKIADADQSFPRGKYMGTSTGSLTEAGRFKRYRVYGGFIDILDLAWVEDHDGPLPHPVQDRAQ